MVNHSFKITPDGLKAEQPLLFNSDFCRFIKMNPLFRVVRVAVIHLYFIISSDLSSLGLPIS